MLIPSIDLMSGKIVQLVQGEKKALAFDDFEYWIERFARHSLVQLIDLDAAMGVGDNAGLIARILSRLPCQVGGGIRSLERAQHAIDQGARRVIVGSALFEEGVIQHAFAAQLAATVGLDKLTFGVDSKQGRVAVHGWRTLTGFSAESAMRALNDCCGAFLYTHVDTEGLMQGFPMQVIPQLAAATTRKLMVAGGITTQEEVNQLDEQGIDAIVGMAVYSGRIQA
ncbi:MAG TPA: HisA/HisF-related TIM barrel protein [Terriglobales bacterium]|nr:HisA/HisF-related TIM barrel protein [Terriglobales bacterium]